MNIEQMAREAGYDVDPDGVTMPYTHDDDPADEREFLQRFAALVRAHALEEAAAVCENQDTGQSLPHDDSVVECAKLIRALKASPDAGEPKPLP